MPNAIILLAAGSSSRLGRPKQLLLYKGQTLLRRAGETAVAAAAGAPVVVVTGSLHPELLPELAGLPVTVVHNPEWAVGMGASILTGLAYLDALPQPPTAVTVMLCDQPFVTPALLAELRDTYVRTGRPIVASAYAETQGVPVYFATEALSLLRALPAGAGAGQLLRQHAALVATVPFPLGAVDVDTPEQYAALLAGE
ncbi:nucleotidyltransferase family protein [Hymenobacter canadensis]|uniref:Nucleotidyltransferase family protein n=1 Tax=Hymenobacter canadensis TaxID=2999067 RepID=A0ABY7LSP9_9BACT|nr:nucleotidyltransferase family protein [Hymenobacter canadensis]WBA42496.1 nucleotidyltransferase family protein [Hymenobacter canadensis]